jgi:hypothetical protein
MEAEWGRGDLGLKWRNRLVGNVRTGSRRRSRILCFWLRFPLVTIMNIDYNMESLQKR